MPTKLLPAEIAAAADTARLPALYEEAKAALAKAEAIDEVREWADRAAALATYAHMAHDEGLENCAKRIRLRAVRRMGELLAELDARGRSSKSQEGPTFSRTKAAEQAGLSKTQRVTAVRLAQIPEKDFETAVESAFPPGATRLADSWYPRMPKAEREVTIVADSWPEEPKAERVVTIVADSWPEEPKAERVLTNADFEEIALKSEVDAIVEFLHRRIRARVNFKELVGRIAQLEKSSRIEVDQGLAFMLRLKAALDRADREPEAKQDNGPSGSPKSPIPFPRLN